MTEKLKWILGIGISLVIALIVAVYVILSSYDFNHLKPEIAKKELEATGRELTIGGDMELAIGFSPSLVLKEIKFQNATWGTRPELLKVKRLEIRVSLLPLLFKNIKVERFMVVEPDILIETDRL